GPCPLPGQAERLLPHRLCGGEDRGGAGPARRGDFTGRGGKRPAAVRHRPKLKHERERKRTSMEPQQKTAGSQKYGASITYVYQDKLYVNMTNQCPNHCDFCLRNNSSGSLYAENLWYQGGEPTKEE